MNKTFLANRFVKVEKVVKKVLIDNNCQDVYYFSRIYKHWDVIIGESLSGKTSPQKIEKKVLYIMVEDAAYSHHLKYYEKNIIDLISSPEICGEGVIRKIVFRVSPDSLIDKPRIIKEKKSKVSKNISAEAKELSDKSSQIIKDKRLKRSFARLMSKTLSKDSVSK